jgi:hypothetical protein
MNRLMHPASVGIFLVACCTAGCGKEQPQRPQQQQGEGPMVLEQGPLRTISTELVLGGTSVAQRPELAGTVLYDKVTPVRFRSFSGLVQSRVVKSTTDGAVEFSYRIENQSENAQVSVRQFAIKGRAFADVGTDMDFSIDSMGTIGPGKASRTKNDEIVFSFEAIPITQRNSSHFFFIRTKATEFKEEGAHFRVIIQVDSQENGNKMYQSDEIATPQPSFRK